MKQRPAAAPVACLTLTLLAPSVSAGDRFRLYFSGAFKPSTIQFTTRASFTEYLETGTETVDHKYESRLAIDGGAELRLARRLGLNVAFSTTHPEGSASYSASVPHPLYFNRPRSVQGTTGALKYRENAIHLDLALLGEGRGHLDFSLFAGATLFDVRFDEIESLQFRETYPFDSIGVDPPVKTLDEKPVGLNVGGRLDYRFGGSRTFGLGAQVRFSQAKVKLASGGGSFNAGGFAAGLGVKLYF